MKTKTLQAFTKTDEGSSREVEQIVSVFGNVDSVGDRVNLGAFSKSIDKWASDGPLPAVFSHQWSNPAAIIGDVKHLEELAPGDALLPERLKELGGLLARYTVDDRPFADDVLHQMKSGRLRQASFAYDTLEENYDSKSGVNDLIELDLIEVGPTLRGANQATDLISAKSLFELKEALAANSHHPFLPSKDDEAICAYPDCARGARSNVHIDRITDLNPKSLETLIMTIDQLSVNLKAIVDVYGEDITKNPKSDEQTAKDDEGSKSGSKSEEEMQFLANRNRLALLRL